MRAFAGSAAVGAERRGLRPLSVSPHDKELEDDYGLIGKLEKANYAEERNRRFNRLDLTFHGDNNDHRVSTRMEPSTATVNSS
jgi:hypothetical protein